MAKAHPTPVAVLEVSVTVKRPWKMLIVGDRTSQAPPQIVVGDGPMRGRVHMTVEPQLYVPRGALDPDESAPPTSAVAMLTSDHVTLYLYTNDTPANHLLGAIRCRLAGLKPQRVHSMSKMATVALVEWRVIGEQSPTGISFATLRRSLSHGATRHALDSYRRAMHDSLHRAMHVQPGRHHVIYYDLNPLNKETPYIAALLMDMRCDRSNEAFWRRQLAFTRALTETFGLAWDPATAWATMLCAAITLAYAYVEETKDVYQEGWYTLALDCEDAAMMIYQLHALLVHCPTEDPELRAMQRAARQYVPCTGFCYVRGAPSASVIQQQLIPTAERWSYSGARQPATGRRNTADADAGPVLGHWVGVFVPKDYFAAHAEAIVLDELQGSGGGSSTLPVLVAEGTQFMLPALASPRPQRQPLISIPHVRFPVAPTDGSFYHSMRCLYTAYFWEKHHIPGFYCGTRSSAKYKARYGIPMRDLLAKTDRAVFYPMPTCSDVYREHARATATTRLPIPRMCVDPDTGRFARTFATEEPRREWMEAALQTLARDGGYRVDGRPTARGSAGVFSLDDLRRDDGAALKQLVARGRGDAGTVQVFEPLENAFVFVVTTQ